MAALFEHIVSRRLSQEYENVATEALTFIVHEDQKAHDAFVELLRGAQPDLDRNLVFSTQEGDPRRAGLRGTRPIPNSK